jgi:uncharacterized membrane protein (UPF0127 family)
MRALGPVAACLLAIGATAGLAAGAHLPRMSIVIETARAPVRFTVEIAADEPSRMRGLMFRTHLAPDAGMLFEFPDDHFRSFWMKNTVLPLDMLFIRADGTISSIAAHTTPYSEQEILSKEPVREVLEINAGRAAALGIVPGDRMERGALAPFRSGR